jgi:hypothetical protein
VATGVPKGARPTDRGPTGNQTALAGVVAGGKATRYSEAGGLAVTRAGMGTFLHTVCCEGGAFREAGLASENADPLGPALGEGCGWVGYAFNANWPRLVFLNLDFSALAAISRMIAA